MGMGPLVIQQDTDKMNAEATTILSHIIVGRKERFRLVEMNQFTLKDRRGG